MTLRTVACLLRVLPKMWKAIIVGLVPQPRLGLSHSLRFISSTGDAWVCDESGHASYRQTMLTLGDAFSHKVPVLIRVTHVRHVGTRTQTHASVLLIHPSDDLLLHYCSQPSIQTETCFMQSVLPVVLRVAPVKHVISNILLDRHRSLQPDNDDDLCMIWCAAVA